MLLAVALAASITQPPSPYLTDNVIYMLEDAGYMVNYAYCDNDGKCKVTLETQKIELKCDKVTFECVVTKTEDYVESI